jgi:hypothetical protein
MDSVIIRILDLPPKIHGATVKDENGDYNMYLNARDSEERRVRAYWHEIDHIRLGHFYRTDEFVAMLEAEVKKAISA